MPAKRDALLDELEQSAKPKDDKPTSKGGFDLLDELEKQAQSGGGKPWIAESDGDSISGYIKAVYEVPSEYAESGSVPALDIEDREGTVWSVRAYHTYLAEGIAKHNPEVGNAIAIRYGGKIESKNGRSYHGYTVVVKAL